MIAKMIKMNIEILPKFSWTFFEDNGAKILTPAGVKESKTIWENNPKKILSINSM